MWKNPNKKEFFDSVISFPVSCDFDFTELAIYPNFCPKDFNMSFEFYNEDGGKIGTSSYIASIETKKTVPSVLEKRLSEVYREMKRISKSKITVNSKSISIEGFNLQLD